jgi:protein-L-isoaspartate(D-aspartate) O-methyltransferase
MAEEQLPAENSGPESPQQPETAETTAPRAPLSAEELAAESARLRQQLVEQLKARDVLHSEELERALLRVPREAFLPDIAEREGLEYIYADEAIVTKRGSKGAPISSSSAPSMMAIMLEQLDLHPGQRVLEIGAGTGYNAALLAELVGDPAAIVTIDIEPDVVEQARRNLASAGYAAITVLCADGAEGAPALAPFDRIELTVAADDVAPAWMDQLAPGGRLVLPLELHRQQRGQISLALVKQEGYLESVAAACAFFIPMRGNQAMSAARASPLSVVTADDKNHHWELNVFGTPLHASAAIRRDALHLLSGPYETRDLHLDAAARDLLAYLELRYGDEETIYAWSGHASWGFEGWAAGVLVHPAREQNSALPFVPRSGRFSHQPGIALLRSATASPDDAGLDHAILYGSSSALHRLQNIIREWKRLNRPDLSTLRVRVYPQGSAPTPASDERLITKRSAQLLLSFQPPAAPADSERSAR